MFRPQISLLLIYAVVHQGWQGIDAHGAGRPYIWESTL